MKRALLVVLMIPVLAVSSGCAKLAHLEQLLTLKGLSENRDAQTVLVEKQNASFDKLVLEALAGRMDQYPDQASFRKNFGDPVVRRPCPDKAKGEEEWIYRYATEYFSGEKIYIYFDAQGQKVGWEHLRPSAPVTSEGPSEEENLC